MRLSKERLFGLADSTGFRPDLIEKAVHLLHLLESLFRHPFLKNRLALKGGTALNLFLADLPRLSIDLDLNYVGCTDLEGMRAERPKVEQAIRAVCAREGFGIRRVPPADQHAGGKWSLRYSSTLGAGGDLEIDLNYMFRVPLWPPTARTSIALGDVQASSIPVLDLHELAAGKLTALFSRRASRDLFDVHLLLRSMRFDQERLRLAFVVYGAMSRRDWRTISPSGVDVDPGEARSQLFPLLRRETAGATAEFQTWLPRLVAECREALTLLLPFSEGEKLFLERLLDQGKVEPLLLTQDESLAQRIGRQPMLHWKAQHVQRYRKQGE